MEIGGHTDSQGRETMNLALSQARADAVLEALMARRLLAASLAAKGYGEAVPIADNATEAGRDANRRIEFTLLLPEATAAAVDAPGAAEAEPAPEPETVAEGEDGSEAGSEPGPETGPRDEPAAAEEAPGADESD